MKNLQRKIAGILLGVAAVPFLIAGGLSRFEQTTAGGHPNGWMALAGLLLLGAGVLIYGPKRP